MTLFIALAALMVLLALAIVIVPLVRGTRRDATLGEDLTVLADGMRELQAEKAAGELTAAEFEQARIELERQALQTRQQTQASAQSSLRANWGAALATAIVLPLLATVLYLTVGQPGTLTRAGALAQAGGGGGEASHAPDDAAVAALQARLAKDGTDVEGWVLLARSYFQMRRIDDALEAYKKATTLMADNPDLWVEYANTLAIAHDRNLSGEPTQFVERALTLDPNNFNALAFAGLAALQRGDSTAALAHWGRLKSLLPEGSEDSKRIDELLARARGDEAPPAPAAARTQTPPPAAKSAQAPAGAEIRGTVTVAAPLATKVAASDTLFIFARAPNGPPMPLAAVRTRADGWPVTFTLDDSSAMVQGMQLSKFANVNLVARISRLGSANAQPGDIEGSIENVAVGSKDVRIVMDRVIER